MDSDEYIAGLFKKKYAISHRFMGNRTSTASRNSTIGDALGIRDSNSAEKMLKKKGSKVMKLQEFYSMVAKLEGKNSESSIGNIREITKVINGILSKKLKTKDFLYKIIRRM